MTPRPVHRDVALMLTCLCDMFFDDVARATVEVLEHLGCRVAVPREQTCCGQPGYNAGQWTASRRVARHAMRVFAGDGPVVTPSGSCAKMLSHAAPMLFEREQDRAAAEQLASRAWELSDYIVNGLGVTAWGGRFEASLAFHRSCHSRGTSCARAALTLLSSIRGVRIVEVDEAEQCCGFGGLFATSFPSVSREIGAVKLAELRSAAADAVVSADMGCLMHLDGLARKEGRPVRTLHVVQVLRDALRANDAGMGS